MIQHSRLNQMAQVLGVRSSSAILRQAAAGGVGGGRRRMGQRRLAKALGSPAATLADALQQAGATARAPRAVLPRAEPTPSPPLLAKLTLFRRAETLQQGLQSEANNATRCEEPPR